MFDITLNPIKMKTLLLFLTFLAFIHINVAGQEKTDSTHNEFTFLKRNVVYGDVGFFLLGGSINLNYEHILKERKNGFLSLKGTYGQWVFWDIYGDLFSVTADFVHGKQDHHMEIDVGAVLLVEVDSYNEHRRWEGNVIPLPVLFGGYRFQKPDGHFVFKTGLGFPSVVQVGIGYAFR